MAGKRARSEKKKSTIKGVPHTHFTEGSDYQEPGGLRRGRAVLFALGNGGMVEVSVDPQVSGGLILRVLQGVVASPAAKGGYRVLGDALINLRVEHELLVFSEVRYAEQPDGALAMVSGVPALHYPSPLVGTICLEVGGPAAVPEALPAKAGTPSPWGSAFRAMTHFPGGVFTLLVCEPDTYAGKGLTHAGYFEVYHARRNAEEYRAGTPEGHSGPLAYSTRYRFTEEPPSPARCPYTELDLFVDSNNHNIGVDTEEALVRVFDSRDDG